jgi:hypothetical protein
MPATQPTYFTAYRSLRLTRDAQGLLTVEFNTNGAPLTFTAQDHTDSSSRDRHGIPTGGVAVPCLDFRLRPELYSYAEWLVWTSIWNAPTSIT